MGNTVCTDAVPFSLEDILHSSQPSPRRCVAQFLPVGVIDKFTRYQHNFKAFVFRQGTTGAAVRRLDPSQLHAQPFDLAQAKIKLEETAAYVLVHVQCRPVATIGSASPDAPTPRGGGRLHREFDGDLRGNEEAPAWSRILAEVFTPRGLATALASNIDKPSLFLSPSVAVANADVSPTAERHPTAAALRLGELDFRFSVHILTGKKAHQLVASVALLHALRIEQSLMENDEAVRGLFFNCRPSHWTSDAKPVFPACVPVGELVSYRSFSRRNPPIIEESHRNAILRILHNIRWKPSFPAILATPPTARGSLSRGSTPRGMLAPVTTTSVYQQAFMQSLAGAAPSASQASSALEVPRLRFAPESARQSAADLPLGAPRRQSSTLASSWTQREGASAASNATSARTPQAPATPPLLPFISSLRLSEALNGRGTAEADPENDEIRMTEERVKKLKAATPEATEILPWLFVGGEEAAGDRVQLLSKGITSIVNTVAFSVGNAHTDVFHYLGLYLSDAPDEPIFSLFPIVIRFVEESRVKGGKTFIHCHQGVSRSCSFVIAYIMWNQGLCYDRAFEFVRARRNVCSPNTGFYVNLLLWENQLATPVFNKAYAYVPYTEYMFPFSFRLALAFRAHENAHSDDDSQVVNSFVRVVHHTDKSYAVDPRLSYGILFGGRDSQSGAPATLIYSYFFAGSDCDAIVRQEAKEDWEAFIRYNFYHGQRRRSTNNKGEVVAYAPIPALGQPTRCLAGIQDLEDVVNEHMFSRRRRASDGARGPKPVLAQLECWDKLLAHEDMIVRLSNFLAEEQRVKLASLSRKRMREEERRGLAKVSPPGSTPRISSYRSAGARGNTVPNPAAPAPALVAAAAAVDSASSVSPLSTAPLAKSTTTKSAAAGAKVAVPHIKTSSAPPTAGSKPLGGEVEIYAYPFTGSPLTNILDIADMEPDGCYVVLVPAAASGRHRVFLWFGCNSSVTEPEAWQAYWRSLKVDKDVRLWNETVLESPLEEVARDGEEPDELILALE
ncbi:putative dual specificity protein phosphatase [Trypanosoma conorhini]|uniref:Putative dual specificity protein phosphatase n=1 Tax=Trypanosoma conorhini TaxID=83891 RepID=A0A3R7LEX3_9TRYP|nr:putative dual specificity protein phosphatase [Trypanosoma conorhini]RNF27065.1 putative dual specificity protein phosphatase [Trypanosoma conorhini]